MLMKTTAITIMIINKTNNIGNNKDNENEIITLMIIITIMIMTAIK